jgi:alanine dehydrogenase
MLASPPNIERVLTFTDLLIASPAVRGERAPVLVTREMLKRMRPRSVVMDLSVDMGGCLETSRPTYFPRPTYEVEGIVHFCVPNLPAIAARSATLALTNALLPYLAEIASSGFDRACESHSDLRRGTYLLRGRCVKESLARTFGLPHEPPPPSRH